MADIRRGIGPDNRVERLPWLEPVEDEDDYPEADGRRGWLVIGVAALALVAVVSVGVVVARRWHGAHADLGGIIRAPTTPYKVRPAEAGGLAVDAGGVVAEQTGTGADIDAPLALVAPEAPVVGAGAKTPDATAPAPAAAQPKAAATAKAAPVILAAPKPVVAPPPGTPPAAPSTAGGTVQLGAFSSEAKARAAWKSLSKRFSYLQAMAVSITPADVNGTTFYRLRASGGEGAATICARLQVAGEVCAVVG